MRLAFDYEIPAPLLLRALVIFCALYSTHLHLILHSLTKCYHLVTMSSSDVQDDPTSEVDSTGTQTSRIALEADSAAPRRTSQNRPQWNKRPYNLRLSQMCHTQTTGSGTFTGQDQPVSSQGDSPGEPERSTEPSSASIVSPKRPARYSFADLNRLCSGNSSAPSANTTTEPEETHKSPEEGG